MHRFEQRLKQRMRDPEFAVGYREMSAELDMLTAIEQAREALHISKEELATRLGRKREVISRLLNSETANPTLDSLTEILAALGLTAEITLRRARDDEQPIAVKVAL